MIRKIKILLAKWLAPYLEYTFIDEMNKVCIKHNTKVLQQIRDILQEAQENGLDIYTEINPHMMAPFAIGLGYTEQPEDKKENPFRIIKDEEE